MTFTIDKPDSGPSPALDAATIQQNFATFGTVLAANHIGLNLNNKGDHSTVIFETQTVDPVIDNGESVLYQKDATSFLNTQPQLFLRIPKFLPTNKDPMDAPNAPMQLTYNTVNITGPQYQSFLIGGYLIYFGSTTDITLPIVLSPLPTQIIVAIAAAHTMTTVGTPTPFTVSTRFTSPVSFAIDSALNGVVIPYNFTWMAIARA